MFFSRSIQHKTFGKLKPVREGTYYRAKVDFTPVGHPVYVAVRGKPCDGMAKMFEQIATKYATLQAKVLQLLHRECETGRKGRPDLAWPSAAAPTDLLRSAPLEEIWLEDAAAKRFMFSYRSTADKDHHIHMFFKNGKLESVASER
jgi:hypothetical protein